MTRHKTTPVQPPSKKNTADVSIEDCYALKPGELWRGFFSENISFIALCVYFFFEYVRPQQIYPVIDVLPWAQLSLIITIMAAFFERSTLWVSDGLNALMILFFMIVVASSVAAFAPEVSFDNLYVFLNWIIIYFLMITILNTPKRLLFFILCFLLYNFKMAQTGFFSFAERGFSFQAYGLTGAPGWFHNSGEFATALLIFSAFAIAFIISAMKYWGRYKKLFMYFLPFAALIAVLGTSSRGGQLGLAAMLIWVLLHWKYRMKAIATVTLVTVLMINILPQEQMDRFTDAGNDETSVQRLEYWKHGLTAMDEYPLLGIGYTNWLTYMQYKFPAGLGPLGEIEMTHNTFIEAGAELGYSGLFTYILLILGIFYKCWGTKKYAKKINDDFLYYMAFGIELGLIGFLVSSFFMSVLFYPFFWVQLGLAVSFYSVAKNTYLVQELATKKTVGE